MNVDSVSCDLQYENHEIVFRTWNRMPHCFAHSQHDAMFYGLPRFDSVRKGRRPLFDHVRDIFQALLVDQTLLQWSRLVPIRRPMLFTFGPTL
jgi:hypothetical protein